VERRVSLLSLFCCILFNPSARAQRDSPVWDSYLSPISVQAESGSLSADFLFHKNGGPHEHSEHQCYVLLYLKQDEQAILKTVSDAVLVKKKDQDTKPFLKMLTQRKLVVTLETKVAKRISEDDREYKCHSGFCFPFKFKFDNETLLNELDKLANFDAENVTVSGKATWFNDDFKLMVFVPVNDSVYSTLVSPKLRKTYDFANVMDDETSILYLRALPYSFGFKGYEQNLILYIN
jgi:hypothetical protein